MQEETLFEITLNNEGRGHILRLFTRVRFIFIASIIWTAINLFSTINALATAVRLFRQYNSGGFDLRVKIIYIYSFLSLVLLPLQAWSFYAFSKKINESLDEQDTLKFNSSFGMLNTFAFFSLVAVMVNIAFTFSNILSTYYR